MREQPPAVVPSEERGIPGVAKKTLEGKQPNRRSDQLADERE